MQEKLRELVSPYTPTSQVEEDALVARLLDLFADELESARARWDDDIYDDGRQLGYEEGYQDGYDEGCEENCD
jgi:flagellar biosynthesis/type III secretory pathway protein FliH